MDLPDIECAALLGWDDPMSLVTALGTVVIGKYTVWDIVKMNHPKYMISPKRTMFFTQTLIRLCHFCRVDDNKHNNFTETLTERIEKYTELTNAAIKADAVKFGCEDVSVDVCILKQHTKRTLARFTYVAFAYCVTHSRDEVMYEYNSKKPEVVVIDSSQKVTDPVSVVPVRGDDAKVVTNEPQKRSIDEISQVDEKKVEEAVSVKHTIESEKKKVKTEK
jgi:hypothetical protein